MSSGVATGSTTVTVDTSRLPLIDITVSGTVTDADCRRLFATLNGICEPGARVANVVDLRQLNAFAVTAPIRQAAARAFFDGIDRRRAATICEARIVTNALARGCIVAFDWVTGSKWPCAVFPTREMAVAWVGQKVAKDAELRAASSSTVAAIYPESGAPELLKAG